MKISIENELFIPGPSLTAEKQGPGLNFSIENENFKPRMKISSENENFVREGMFFFFFSCVRARMNFFDLGALWGGTEGGGSILLHFCGSPNPFSMQHHEPFLPLNLHPHEGNALKHRLKLIRGKPKGDGGKGTGEKKCHDNLRQTSRQFTTFYDNLRHFMTISVSLFH